jgi:transposase
MKKEERRKYYRSTTFLQRKLMIETYLDTHNISKSCRMAGVAINTFRRWYPRYLEDGEEGIKKPKSHVNKQLGRINEKYKNNGKRIISPSGVQKILERASLWKNK